MFFLLSRTIGRNTIFIKNIGRKNRMSFLNLPESLLLPHIFTYEIKGELLHYY